MELRFKMVIRSKLHYIGYLTACLHHVSDMIFNVRKQISYLSQGTTLEAGTIILTGTPAGIGYFHKPVVVLKDGGDSRVHIEKIGTLINRIRYE